MTHPIYFIKSIDMAEPKNKAQNYIIREIEKTLQKTIYNIDVLQEYVEYVKDLAAKAQKMYPRVNEIKVRRDVTSGGTTVVTVNGSTCNKGFHHLVPFITIYICFICGEWKGGIK